MDDLVLLGNTTAQKDSLLHGLEQAARRIGLYVNSDEKEFTHFKQDGIISALNDKPSKSVDQLKYPGSNILSTKSENIRLS